jgi:hypothetical protein
MKAWGFATMVGGLWVVACGGVDADLAANREKWERERPDEYLIVTCGTGFDPGCSLSAVSAGTVVEQAHSWDRAPQGDDWTLSEDVPKAGDPVEDLFDAAEHQGDDCSLRRISFDDEFGYVNDYYADCGAEGGGQKVMCFEPDTVDVTVCTN